MKFWISGFPIPFIVFKNKTYKVFRIRIPRDEITEFEEYLLKEKLTPELIIKMHKSGKWEILGFWEYKEGEKKGILAWYLEETQNVEKGYDLANFLGLNMSKEEVEKLVSEVLTCE